MKLQICIVQFDRSQTDPGHNAAKMYRLLKKESTTAEVILLPEGWLGPVVFTQEEHHYILTVLQECLTSKTLVVSGGQYTRHNNKTVAAGAFITKHQISVYEKVFPSHAIGERDFINFGDKQPVVVNHLGIPMGAVLCVDLFYPEITRRLALQGAMIVFNPANIPEHRMNLWQRIGATRAAENTIFLAMANNTKTSYPDRRPVMGGSFAAGPDGSYFQSLGSDEDCLRLTLDLDLIKQTRLRWKYLEDIKTLSTGHEGSAW